MIQRAISEINVKWKSGNIICRYVNKQVRIDENQLKCEQVRFYRKRAKFTHGELFSVFKSVKSWILLLYKIQKSLKNFKSYARNSVIGIWYKERYLK